MKDYSQKSWSEFWEKLKEKDWVNLSDRGKLRSLSHLPRTLRDLTDDPFRTLAWLVRKVGGFKKVKSPFSEFKWADFYRAIFGEVDLSTAKSTEDAVNAALKVTTSENSKNLPGWTKDGTTSVSIGAPDDCRDQFVALSRRLFAL